MKSKTKIVRAKFLPIKPPIGATIVTYLLFKSIDPQGTAKGIILTLFIGWLVLIWALFITQVRISDMREPVWQNDKL